jgi:nucleotide-binding universal stress UspA family protein
VGSVVVGFIDTPEGYAAVEAGIAEARWRGIRLVVVHSMLGGSHETAADYIASSEALEGVRQLLDTRGIEHEVHEYVRGNRPARDLIEAAQEHEGEILIIGIRSRSATGKALLGSNAHDIIHDAPVPVLCVKAP